MTEQPANAPLTRLTPLQQAAVDFARSDLAEARTADLAAMDDAELILLAERLRGRLDTVLGVLDEAVTVGDTDA